MRTLDDIRKEITENDKQIARLFEKRMNLSKEVADYKREHEMKVFDASREAAVVENFTNSLCNKTYTKWASQLIHELMNCSKEYQRSLNTPPCVTEVSDTVVCQGTVGAYGEEAAIAYFGTNAHIRCLGEFSDVFQEVSCGKAKYGIVPIENSSTGAIGSVYDLFGEYDCKIAGEYVLKINHSLMACEGADIDGITDVYSHTQGFEQCAEFLKKYPHLNLIPYHNTAVSAKYVSECGDKTKAAIASKRAAQIYNLKILAENINSNYNNYTRFVVISKSDCTHEKADKVSVMLRLAHKKGQLGMLMRHFDEYGVNLLKIESRPIPDRSWEYSFFIDFEANLNNSEMEGLTDKLRSDSEAFCILGNYKSA